MQVLSQNQVEGVRERQPAIAIAATFTAEPIQDSLAFWLKQLNFPWPIEFAPYHQVFQQLLDPASPLSENQQGLNVILVRFEDWQRSEAGEPVAPATPADDFAKLERNVQDLVQALQVATQRSATPYLLCLCPASPAVLADAERIACFLRLEEWLVSQLTGVGNLLWLTAAELAATYPVADYYDPKADQLGHIPFTPLFFASLGTAIARKLFTLRSTPHKVIVLDCDQTLWKGVCGEDGPLGIELDPPRQALQEFMVAQHDLGMLICLCSKNNEADVVEVYERRSDLLLRREHIVAWRVNWQAKSENLKSLAEELNLGLDSFIFIDDNPVECAEVRANCPEVLTLQLPVIEADIPRFLKHVWAFDRTQVTEEDKQRTLLYKQNLERARFQKQSLTLDGFLSDLGLTVRIVELASQHLARAAQLTQRTNQFNLTTRRRSESEIQQLCQSENFGCCVVAVSDRFGDYGIVGVLIFELGAAVLTVDTFLLSCRVLGRGVEHRMLNHLAAVAQAQGLGWLNLPYIASAKNQPALNFLESVGAEFKQSVGEGLSFKLPVEFAATLAYAPGSAPERELAQKSSKSAQALPASAAEVTQDKSARLTQIANEFYAAGPVLRRIESQWQQRPQLQRSYIAPRSQTEHLLCHIWEQLLRVEQVGVQDNFFDLGGSSVLAPRLFAQIAKSCGKELSIATLFQAPTVEQLAKLLDQQQSATAQALSETSPLLAIQPGGSQQPMFFIHGLGGPGTLFYCRFFVRHFGLDQPVYGLQPYGLGANQLPYCRVEDMAAHYIREIRSVQPQGPYCLGGICFGGIIALEMAQQLRAQGERVALLALLDTYGPNPGSLPPAPKPASASLWQQVLRDLGNLGQLKPAELLNNLRRAKHWLKQLVYDLRFRPDFFFNGRFAQNRLGSGLMQLACRVYRGLGQPLPSPLRIFRVREGLQQALDSYVIQPYSGRITLFRAGEQPAGTDYDLGLGEFAEGGLEIHEVPGGHHTLTREPHVWVLAERLRICLAEAQAEG